MSKFLFLLFVYLLFNSCTSDSQDLALNNLEVLASSKSYNVYGQKITKDLNDYRAGLYDLDEVSEYIMKYYSDVKNLCELEISNNSVKGLSTFITNNCEVSKAYEQFIDEFPSYELLSREDRKEVHRIYTTNYKDPSSILPIGIEKN